MATLREACPNVPTHSLTDRHLLAERGKAPKGRGRWCRGAGIIAVIIFIGHTGLRGQMTHGVVAVHDAACDMKLQQRAFVVGDVVHVDDVHVDEVGLCC